MKNKCNPIVDVPFVYPSFYIDQRKIHAQNINMILKCIQYPELSSKSREILRGKFPDGVCQIIETYFNTSNMVTICSHQFFSRNFIVRSGVSA